MRPEGEGGGRQDAGEAPLLSIENLSTHFSTYEGVAKVLDGVSFSIAKGEFLGVVGETGCGKSVTGLSVLRILPRNGRIVSGTIRYGGADLTALSEAEMRGIRGGRIAMIFQHPQASLNPVFTIREQMETAMRIHRRDDRPPGREIRDHACSLLLRVGLPDPPAILRKYPHELSGGMQQRVMIAIALSSSPGLLIADEPTTALDVTIQAQILALMARLREETGMGVMLITHNMGVVASVCDRVVIMYAGQIVEEGPTSAVFTRPLHPYARGLLASIPAWDQREGLAPIPGSICGLIDPPPGCRFAPRCEKRMPVCSERRPDGTTVEAKHTVFCHLYGDGAGKEATP